ncbi:MAG: eukaryotic-like serine/threonine-protein kinase [Fimbriimonadaceae bacterium]|jgi:serine/threonine-protein kinase|nr:eukaryotic-like serine/threonine-protein kinase [Fimbriimonadaceae bacterium]
MSSTPPSTLGKYQIIREIARSNDIVYEAYDSLMNRRVALKELAMPGGSSSQQREDRIKRFLREARAAGSLAHPNIMTVFEVGQESERYFIAMEYLDGKTLRNELDTKGFLPPERASEIATAVLQGLDYAHSKGVIHRDIKPDNIQLLSTGGIKLTDFGIARLTFEPNLTMDGQVFGTPSYMSPEQVVGRDIDARSDLFSVGVVLYEMLCGAKPFPGDSVVTITYSIMNKPPERPTQINWAIWQVIEKALDKSPQMRYRTAQDFEQALAHALGAAQSTVMGAPPQQQMSPPPYNPPAYGSQQVYGIQQQPPTGQNPYGVPQQQAYGIQQQPSGAQNPYGNQMPMASGQYVQPQQLSGPVSVPPSYGVPMPIYYPPPPRKPLFTISPQAKRAIAQLFIYLVAFTAVVGLFVVGIDKMSGAIADAVGAKLSPAGAKPGAKADPADEWNRRGLSAQNDRDYKSAEENFTEATKVSPNNAETYVNLGELFVGNASRISDADPEQASARREYMRRAAESFEIAARLEKPGDKRDHASIRAAETWYALALMHKAAGQPEDARRRLAKALMNSASNPKLHNDIQTLLNQWSGIG